MLHGRFKRVERFLQCGTLVPGSQRARVIVVIGQFVERKNISPRESRNWHKPDLAFRIVHLLGQKLPHFRFQRFILFPIVPANQIHFIQDDQYLLHTQSLGQKGVFPQLSTPGMQCRVQIGGIDRQQGCIGGTRPGNHGGNIVGMSRRILQHDMKVCRFQLFRGNVHGHTMRTFLFIFIQQPSVIDGLLL